MSPDRIPPGFAALSTWIGLALLTAAPAAPAAAPLLASAAVAAVVFGRLTGRTSAGPEPDAPTLGSSIRRLGRATAFATGLLAASWLLQSLAAGWLLTEPVIPGFARAVGLALAPIWQCWTTPTGELGLRNHDGALLFAMTPEKSGLLPFSVFLVLGAIQVGARLRSLLWLLAIVSTVAVLRGAVGVARFAALPEVLAAGGQNRMEIFCRPNETLAWLIGTAILTVSLTRSAAVRPAPTARRGAARLALAAVAIGIGCGALSVYGLALPRAVPKAGRVLVDDRFSDVWEPAARRLTNDWFGDFSTYSFSSAVEWLSHHFATTVNPVHEYTDQLLADYDVLIIKTPSNSITETENEAILRFVARGGGLFLIGDHTNLLGMSYRLNRLAEPAGISFRFDSVMDGDRFSYFTPQSRLVHPTVRRVRGLEFMTSCSLAITHSVEPVMVIEKQSRQSGDYATNSFFGSLKSDPRLPYGPSVLAAVGRYGSGRIAAFSDSTVLSSFALFEYDRENFLIDTVAYLNTIPADESIWNVLLLTLGILSLGLGIRAGHACTSEWRVFACTTMPAAAWFLAHIAVNGVHARAFPPPTPLDTVPRLTVWGADTEAQFPPVLGASVSENLDVSYDTWLAAVARSGVFPKITGGLDDALQERTMFVLNPRFGLLPWASERLRQWVEGGGTLIVGIRRDRWHPSAIDSYVNPLGASLELLDPATGSFRVSGMSEVEPLTPRQTLYTRTVAKGRLVFVVGTEWWSRKRLGHAFHVPGADQRLCYQTLAMILDRLAATTPKHRRTYRILEL